VRGYGERRAEGEEKKKCLSSKHGDFKMSVVLKEAYSVRIDLHDLRSFNDRPLIADHAIDHGEALSRLFIPDNGR
jgi:hypothetical protein